MFSRVLCKIIALQFLSKKYKFIQNILQRYFLCWMFEHWFFMFYFILFLNIRLEVIKRKKSIIFQDLCFQCTLFLPPQNIKSRRVLWCFQGVEKGCIGNKWVKEWLLLLVLLNVTIRFLVFIVICTIAVYNWQVFN